MSYNRKIEGVILSYLYYSKEIGNSGDFRKEKSRILNRMRKYHPEKKTMKGWTTTNLICFLETRKYHEISRHTIRREFAIVKGFWRWAERESFVLKSPMRDVCPPNVNEKEDRRITISSGQIESLKPHMREKDYSIAVVMWACGLRLTETVALYSRWRLPGSPSGFFKAGHPHRDVPIPDKATKKHLYSVFANNVRGYNGSHFGSHLSKAINNADMEPFTARELRDAAITRWVDQGIPVYLIMKWTGCSSTAAFRYYDREAEGDWFPRLTGLNEQKEAG